MEQPDFKAIAAQLRQPEGEEGLETAKRMEDNNAGMIRSCIDHLQPYDNDHLLEIGPGGGAHLPYLMTRAKALHYIGADISATMINMATELNKDLVVRGTAAFTLVDIADGYARLPFADAAFDRIFTVNTIYFWDNAVAQAGELYRVLKPGGRFACCFAPEAFMQTLPFTQYNFNLYTREKAAALLEAAGFVSERIHEEKETIYSNSGPLMDREYIVITVVK